MSESGVTFLYDTVGPDTLDQWLRTHLQSIQAATSPTDDYALYQHSAQQALIRMSYEHQSATLRICYCDFDGRPPIQPVREKIRLALAAYGKDMSCFTDMGTVLVRDWILKGLKPPSRFDVQTTYNLLQQPAVIFPASAPSVASHSLFRVAPASSASPAQTTTPTKRKP